MSMIAGLSERWRSVCVTADAAELTDREITPDFMIGFIDISGQ